MSTFPPLAQSPRDTWDSTPVSSSRCQYGNPSSSLLSSLSTRFTMNQAHNGCTDLLNQLNIKFSVYLNTLIEHNSETVSEKYKWRDIWYIRRDNKLVFIRMYPFSSWQFGTQTKLLKTQFSELILLHITINLSPNLNKIKWRLMC